MKKSLLFVALLPFTAIGAVVGPDTVNAPVANAAAAANQAQGQDQLQGQAQGQLQGQAQGQAAFGGNAAQGQTQGNVNVVGVDTDVRNTSVVGVDVDNRVNSASVSGALSGSISGAEQGQSQSIAEGAIQNSTSTATETSQSQSADNAGNTQTINYNVPEKQTLVSKQDGAIEVRNVPSVYAPNIYPSAPCAVAGSVGASALGWGASIGGSKVNKECEQRETARMFSQLGFGAQGLAVICSTTSAVEVFGGREACMAFGAATAATAPVAAVEQRVEPVRVDTTVPFGQ